MSAIAEVVRARRPYHIDAAEGDEVVWAKRKANCYTQHKGRVIDVQEHGWFVWLECETGNHIHRLQVFRRDRPDDDEVLYFRIVQRNSDGPSWMPVEPTKDPVEVPG